MRHLGRPGHNPGETPGHSTEDVLAVRLSQPYRLGAAPANRPQALREHPFEGSLGDRRGMTLRHGVPGLPC